MHLQVKSPSPSLILWAMCLLLGAPCCTQGLQSKTNSWYSVEMHSAKSKLGDFKHSWQEERVGEHIRGKITNTEWNQNIHNWHRGRGGGGWGMIIQPGWSAREKTKCQARHDARRGRPLQSESSSSRYSSALLCERVMSANGKQKRVLKGCTRELITKS